MANNCRWPATPLKLPQSKTQWTMTSLKGNLETQSMPLKSTARSEKEAMLNAFLGKDSPSYAKVLAQRTKSAQIVSSSYLNKHRCTISPDIKTKRPVPNTDMNNSPVLFHKIYHQVPFPKFFVNHFRRHI